MPGTGPGLRAGCCPTPFLPSIYGQQAVTNRPSRARHRPPAHRPLARGRRDLGMESRRRRGVHARRLREGLLRRAHRGRAGVALSRPRLPDPGAPPRPGARSAEALVAERSEQLALGGGNRGSSRGPRTRIAGWLVEETQRASSSRSRSRPSSQFSCSTRPSRAVARLCSARASSPAITGGLR